MTKKVRSKKVQWTTTDFEVGDKFLLGILFFVFSLVCLVGTLGLFYFLFLFL